MHGLARKIAAGGAAGVYWWFLLDCLSTGNFAYLHLLNNWLAWAGLFSGKTFCVAWLSESWLGVRTKAAS